MHKVCTTLYGKKKLVNEKDIIVRKSSYAVVIKDRKLLLVGTKSTGKYWFAGGVLDEGESKEDAVIREVQEEAGLEVKVVEKLIEVDSYFYFDHANEAYNQHSYFYLCEVLGDAKPSDNNPDELDEAVKPEWVEIESLSEDEFQDYGGQLFLLIKEKYL